MIEKNNSYSTKEVKDAGKEVLEKIEGKKSSKEYDAKKAKKRSFSIKEVSSTDSNVCSYGKKTMIIELKKYKGIIVAGLEFPIKNLKEAIAIANLLNMMKEEGGDWSISDEGSLQREKGLRGYILKTTIYNMDSFKTKFPTLFKNKKSFNKIMDNGSFLKKYNPDKLRMNAYKYIKDFFFSD